MVTELNPENFDESKKGMAIVDFWAPWCGPCVNMAPVFEELSKEYEGKLAFFKVNVEAHNEMGNENGVRGIPCLVVFKDGVEVDRIVGFLPKDALKAKIDEILAK